MSTSTLSKPEYYAVVALAALIAAASVLFAGGAGAVWQQYLGGEPAVGAMIGWAIGVLTAMHGPRVFRWLFSDTDQDERGAVRLVDVIMTFFVLVPIIVLAPVFYKFTGMVSSQADPFSGLLLQLMVPLLLVGLILSVGVSARGG